MLCSFLASWLALGIQHWSLLVVEWSWVLGWDGGLWESSCRLILHGAGRSLVVQCAGLSSPTSEAQAWHPARAPRPCQPHSSECGGLRYEVRLRGSTVVDQLEQADLGALCLRGYLQQPVAERVGLPMRCQNLERLYRGLRWVQSRIWYRWSQEHLTLSRLCAWNSSYAWGSTSCRKTRLPGAACKPWFLPQALLLPSWKWVYFYYTIPSIILFKKWVKLEKITQSPSAFAVLSILRYI